MDKELSGNGQVTPLAALKHLPISIHGDGNNCQVIMHKAGLKVSVPELCGNPEGVTAFGEGELCQLSGTFPGIVRLLNRVGR